MIKLYEIPRGSIIFLEDNKGFTRKIYFDHLDGAYSYCLVDNDPDKLLHLSASTPLEKVEISGVMGYRVVDEQCILSE